VAEPAPSPTRSVESPLSQISNAVVRLLADSTGRGPTQARTIISGDLVVVILQNALTKGERYLVDRARVNEVLAMRRAYQDAIEKGARAAVEDAIGRTVTAFMSTNHINPDLAVEIFILEPLAERDGHLTVESE
jgi:uncharacterized protein YbcI